MHELQDGQRKTKGGGLRLAGRTYHCLARGGRFIGRTDSLRLPVEAASGGRSAGPQGRRRRERFITPLNIGRRSLPPPVLGELAPLRDGVLIDRCVVEDELTLGKG